MQSYLCKFCYSLHFLFDPSYLFRVLYDYLCVLFFFFFFKQKTAYEMRISDWSSDVCSSDLRSSEPGASGPMISMCEPVRCPNACIAERHRPAWQRGADEARLLLREKRLPEPQRVTLQAEVARIQRVLEQIAPGTATPHNGMAGEEEEEIGRAHV